MSNDDVKIYQPLREIKTLLRLRNIPMKLISEQQGINYYVLNKFLNHTPSKSVEGVKRFYDSHQLRTAVAVTLDIPTDVLWGPSGKDVIDKLIVNETLKEKGLRHPKPLPPQFAGWSFRRFIRDFIQLGRVRGSF
jgi:hypothetical protein